MVTVDVLQPFTQTYESGGIHTPPEFRLWLTTLALGMHAREIVETGYDAGYTTLALALSGAHVVGIDNLSEYADADLVARRNLAGCRNVQLIQCDALGYLRGRVDESVDLIFIDDNHNPFHVHQEALEIRRVLRPGGYAVFHDTLSRELWHVIESVFPDWQRVQLPCFSPAAMQDYGAGLVRKPTRNERDNGNRPGGTHGD